MGRDESSPSPSRVENLFLAEYFAFGRHSFSLLVVHADDEHGVKHSQECAA
jgi:hypothetical protein